MRGGELSRGHQTIMLVAATVREFPRGAGPTEHAIVRGPGRRHTGCLSAPTRTGHLLLPQHRRTFARQEAGSCLRAQVPPDPSATGAGRVRPAALAAPPASPGPPPPVPPRPVRRSQDEPRVPSRQHVPLTTSAQPVELGRGSASAKRPPTKAPTGKGPAQKPPARKKKKSIVNQKQRPWGLIIAVGRRRRSFAAAVVGVAIATTKSGSDAKVTKGGQAVAASDPYRQPELPAAAKAITGVTYRVEEPDHTHVTRATSSTTRAPPVGGDHSAVLGRLHRHRLPQRRSPTRTPSTSLEHGAVWITLQQEQAVRGA